MSYPNLLISDLDQQLLGDSDSLRLFRDRMNTHRRNLQLVYLSAASTDAVRELVDCETLVPPDYVIACGGTEVDCFATGESVEGWASRIPPNWNAQGVRCVLSTLSRLELHPQSMQSRHKVSFFPDPMEPGVLQGMQDVLASAGLEFELSYVESRLLDVRPQGVNKAAAIGFLSQRISVPKSRTIVCGSSLDDLALYEAGYCGVVTASADLALRERAPNSVYRSPLSFAGGILDGLSYWSSSQPFASGSCGSRPFESTDFGNCGTGLFDSTIAPSPAH